MAITRIRHQKTRTHLRRAIDYIMDESKTDGGRWVGTHNCCRPYEDFIRTKERMSELRNREDVKSGRQGYHIMISFSDQDADKVSPEIAMKIVTEFTESYLPDYEAVYSVHTNTDHLHCHLIWNSVDCVKGYKYHYSKGDWAKYIQPLTNTLCEKYGLESLIISSGEEKEEIHRGRKTEHLTYDAWKSRKDGNPTWGDIYRADIDAAIEAVRSYGGNFEDFLDELRQLGYSCRAGKNLSMRHPGREKATRTWRLGEGYDLQSLQARIRGVEVAVSRPEELPIPKMVTTRPIRAATFNRVSTNLICRIRTRYVIRIHMGRRATRRLYIPVNSRQLSWQSRKYAVEMNRLVSQYVWLTRNTVHSQQDIDKLLTQYREERKDIRIVRTYLKRRKEELCAELQKLQNMPGSGLGILRLQSQLEDIGKREQILKNKSIQVSQDSLSAKRVEEELQRMETREAERKEELNAVNGRRTDEESDRSVYRRS